jgi:hypothetical protein
MKPILISLVILFSVPCSAQWKNANFGGNVFAFGVHDTSLFVSGVSNDGSTPYIYRFISPNQWTLSDYDIDWTQGNVTSFASLGKYFFAGMTANGGGHGSGWESSDNGAHWTQNGGSPVSTNGTYLFASSSSTVYVSKDTAKDWIAVPCPGSLNFASMGANIFASTGNGIWRSTDSGNHWTALSASVVGTMTVMDSLLFVIGNGSVEESSDLGSNWTSVAVDSAGVSEHVNALVTDGKNLFAGTQRGVLVSTDVGKSWTAKNDSLYNLWGAISPAVTQMIVFDSSLFIEVTYGTGKYYVFDRSISDLIKPDSPASVVQLPLIRDSIEIYPNPTMSQLSIRSGGTTLLGVQVLTVLGVDVLDVPNEHASNLTLDLSKLPSGTYFLQIQTADGLVLRKVVRE